MRIIFKMTADFDYASAPRKQLVFAENEKDLAIVDGFDLVQG